MDFGECKLTNTVCVIHGTILTVTYCRYIFFACPMEQEGLCLSIQPPVNCQLLKANSSQVYQEMYTTLQDTENVSAVMLT